MPTEAQQQPESDFSLSIDGKTYTVNPDDMTLWEAEWLEEHCDAPLAAIDFGRFRALRALTWILLRRDQPDLRFEDTGNLKVSAMRFGDDTDDEGEGEPEPERPTKPKSRPKPTPA